MATKPIRREWYYLDFRKKLILFSGSQDISYEAIPANKAMNALLFTLGDRLTFQEYKAYLEAHGITDRLYHFDGRSAKTVIYEPLAIDAGAFKFLLQYFPPQPWEIGVDDLIGEIWRLNDRQKKGTDKRLVDIAAGQLENVIDLLKKC